jgi:transposase
MDYWAKPPERREQLVLFPTRLDDVIATGHPVRLLDEILRRLDWSAWEEGYDLQRGQPPIHPRVLAGILLYGLLKRLRSTRVLEEALQVRLDFRWLAEGREIDHTTLSKFRLAHSAELRQLFVQIGLVAREAGFLPLEQLAFDGTRVRANNRRTGTRTPDELREAREELRRKYAELEARWNAAEAGEEGRLSVAPLPQELTDTARRLATLDAALAELQRAETAGETLPGRIPVTDPQSRVSPNKEGGFAPNYTPLATVDAQHGLIVACDVIAQTNEDQFLVPQLEAVQQDYRLAAPPAEVLADGLMCSGDNLRQLQDRNITLYSPSKLANPATNPAFRADLQTPVPQDQWDRLPTQEVTVSKGPKQQQLAKEAFVYDADQNCYWCPAGQRLAWASTCQAKLKTGSQERRRYKSDPQACAACLLRARCLKSGTNRREVSRYEHDDLQEALAQRMSTEAAQTKYARRRHVAERPFAMIKQHGGARQFLLRGLDRVRQEWRWLATAFNLGRLMSLFRSRAGPPRTGSHSLLDVATGIT